MGLLADIGSGILDIIRSILETIVGWIVDAIDAVQAALRIIIYRGAQVLAAAVSNDWTFLFVIALSVASLIALPQIVSAVQQAGALVLNSAIVKAIRDGVLKIFDVHLAMAWDVINSVLRTVWPDYRKLVNKLNQAISGFAEALGQGTGFIHAYLAVGRASLTAFGAILGQPPQWPELEWFNSAIDTVQNIDEKFEEYAFHPDHLLTDIIEDILLPAAGDYTDAQQEAFDEINERWEGIKTALAAVDDWRKSINSFVDTMPDVLADAIDERWIPIDKTLSDVYDSVNKYIIPTIDTIVESIGRQIDRQNRINEQFIERLAADADKLSGYDQQFANMLNMPDLLFEDKATEKIVVETLTPTVTGVLSYEPGEVLFKRRGTPQDIGPPTKGSLGTDSGDFWPWLYNGG